MKPEGEHAQRRIDEFTRCLRIKLAGWKESEQGRDCPYSHHVAAVPDLFSLALTLVLEADLPARERALLLAAVVYVVNPGDLLPEAVVGPSGYVDDATVLALVLDSVSRTVPETLVKRYWCGEGVPGDVVRAILDDAPTMLGEVLWSRVQTWVETGT